MSRKNGQRPGADVTGVREIEEIQFLEEKVSSRLLEVRPSASIQQGERARQLQAAGREIINLSQGEPDFPTPANIIEAAVSAMRGGKTHYTDSRGISELRYAIARKLQTENGLHYDPNTEIIVTPGAKAAILNILQAILEPGDEVLAPEPCWLSYADCTTLAGGKYVPIPSTEEDDFKPSAASVAAHVTPRSKILLLNNPNNPTGTVWTKEELLELSAVIKRHGLLVLSDEIYEKMAFVGEVPPSIGALPGMSKHAIIVNGFSKAYAMTGWRIGYLAAPEPLAAQILKVHQHSATCASSISQYAALEALQGTQEFMNQMVHTFRQRREVVIREFNRDGTLSCFTPAGTFFAFLNVQEWEMSSLQAAEFCLEHAGVVMIPGSAYGSSGEGYLRLSFATSADNLRKAAKLLAEAVPRSRL